MIQFNLYGFDISFDKDTATQEEMKACKKAAIAYMQSISVTDPQKAKEIQTQIYQFFEYDHTTHTNQKSH